MIAIIHLFDAGLTEHAAWAMAGIFAFLLIQNVLKFSKIYKNAVDIWSWALASVPFAGGVIAVGTELDDLYDFVDAAVSRKAPWLEKSDWYKVVDRYAEVTGKVFKNAEVLKLAEKVAQGDLLISMQKQAQGSIKQASFDLVDAATKSFAKELEG